MWPVRNESDLYLMDTLLGFAKEHGSDYRILPYRPWPPRKPDYFRDLRRPQLGAFVQLEASGLYLGSHGARE